MKKIIIAICFVMLACSFAMATTTEYSIYSKGYVAYQASNNWPPSDAIFATSTTVMSMIRYLSGGSKYSDYVTLLKFDTSAIPDTATISSARLRLRRAYSPSDDNIYINYYAWDGNYNTTDYISSQAGTAAYFLFSTISNSSYTDVTLSTPTNISKTGYTCFRCRTTGAAPTPSGEYGGNFDASNPPILSVTYTTGYGHKVNGVTSATKVNGVAVPTKVNGQ